MINIRRSIAALLAAALIFAMAGCGGKQASPSPQATKSAENSAVTAAATAYFADFTKNPTVEWADLFALIDGGKNPYILSIRQQDVYDSGHIKGAYLASWGKDLAEKVSMLPTDKPVYIYCYSGQTAGQAVALLRMLGIDAYSVKSGFNYGAVKVDGYKKYLETTANKLPDAGAKFNADVLAFVKSYFNSVADNANYQVAPAAADPLISSGDAVMLDVRQAADYDKGHIEGAVNIPYAKGMQAKFSELPKNKKIIVTCYTGQTAGQTVAILRALGYNAVSLQFGITGANGWTNYIKTKAANNYFASFTENPMITWEALFEKLDKGEKPFILSIRQKDVYDQGHIKGAYLASWGKDLADKVSILPTDKPVYVYCYSGQTAGQAVALLRILGIDAYTVKLGFNYGATAVKGYEKYLETTANELPKAGAKFDPFLLSSVVAYFNSVADNASFQIPPADAQALIGTENAVFVDIRKAEDFAAGHIKGAINIPFAKGMQASFKDLPTNKKIIVTCYTGQTAGQTVAIMRMLGYDAVSLQFGMTGAKGWVTSGLPVVKD